MVLTTITITTSPTRNLEPLFLLKLFAGCAWKYMGCLILAPMITLLKGTPHPQTC